jgi:hypothetical protein
LGNVLSFNSISGDVEIKRVIKTYDAFITGYCVVNIDNADIICSLEHPFLTTVGYIRAGNLGPEYNVLSYKDGMVINLPVNSVDIFDKSIKVYNIEVEDNHTYLVNDNIVHNKGGGGGGEEYPEPSGPFFRLSKCSDGTEGVLVRGSTFSKGDNTVYYDGTECWALGRGPLFFPPGYTPPYSVVKANRLNCEHEDCSKACCECGDFKYQVREEISPGVFEDPFIVGRYEETSSSGGNNNIQCADMLMQTTEGSGCDGIMNFGSDVLKAGQTLSCDAATPYTFNDGVTPRGFYDLSYNCDAGIWSATQGGRFLGDQTTNFNISNTPTSNSNFTRTIEKYDETGYEVTVTYTDGSYQKNKFDLQINECEDGGGA